MPSSRQSTLFVRGTPQRLGILHERSLDMNNIVGLAVFAAGIVLLIFGFNASHSFGSDVSRFFTGNPTDKSIWLLVGGAAAVIVGLVIALRGTRHG